MLKIIPNITLKTTKMEPGERRFAQRLEAFLEDDYSCWFDIPVGAKRRHPDFIILHPARGLLFIEVKDWKLGNIKSITHNLVQLETKSGLVSKANPVEQARQCAYQVLDQLKRDPALLQLDGKHKGNLVFPYGYGVVLTDIKRRQLQEELGVEGESVLPPHLLICQDEMEEKVDPEEFQQRLWGMFNYQFPQKLSLPQIDRIRANLFPEVRINLSQSDLFSTDGAALAVPDIIKVMDMQQEQLARSFGEGHRVVHGVAGSGKTLILGFRCWYLAQTQAKPILVLCYNISLAAKLRAFIRGKGVEEKVQVYYFHDWCAQQLRTYHVDLMGGKAPYWERQVLSVIHGVDTGLIPREQYGAVLIDEGHDFEAEWLKLVVQMVDPETNSLLLLYDDAQAIYKKSSSLDFSLSSVGIQARGRTTILKLNYRNTREILDFAYRFAKDYLQTKDADEDSVPLIVPQVAGNSGPKPIFEMCENQLKECDFIVKCLRQWHDEGIAWLDMAIIYCNSLFGSKLNQELIRRGVPCYWMGDRMNRKSYDPAIDQVILVTRESSKGLEFPRVVVCGLGLLNSHADEISKETRLLYVAMTRAQQSLLVTASFSNIYTQALVDL